MNQSTAEGEREREKERKRERKKEKESLETTWFVLVAALTPFPPPAPLC